MQVELIYYDQLQMGWEENSAMLQDLLCVKSFNLLYSNKVPIKDYKTHFPLL